MTYLLKKTSAAVFMLLALGLTGAYAQTVIDLRGDYLGQPQPGDTPLVFARDIVSTKEQEHGAPMFSPDGNEVFWWTIGLKDRKDFFMTMRRVKGKWTAPGASPFDRAPVFSVDGTRLYFASAKEGEEPCFVEKQGAGWGRPTSVSLVSRFPAVRFVYFPSVARNGTLYFMGFLAGQFVNLGIYRAELRNGVYAEPELLPPSINTGHGTRNWTPFIAPDESYLLFCSTRGLPESDEGDLFVCFRQPDGGWTDPVSLGAPINTSVLERFPVVTPDGNYLFFTRDTPGRDEDVYWVSAGIIARLKAKAIRDHRLRLN
jgi:Tol biopolymer transport system component